MIGPDRHPERIPNTANDTGVAGSYDWVHLLRTLPQRSGLRSCWPVGCG